MKISNAVLIGIGLILLVGVAGSADFYDECKAAADCVAGEAPSIALMFVQSAIGLIMVCLGVAGALDETE